MTPAVEVEDVGLAYRLSRHSGTSLKELVISAARRQVQFESFQALASVSFSVCPGEVLGVIGSNGAGKSTLMKILAGVLPPTSGRVVVRGVLAPLIELGAGFNPELTGIENIALYGTMLGRSPRQMRARTEEILEWAGLMAFADAPLRAYSSGMVARLGFSIAVDTQPDVLLVDEVLSVGDAEFQARSAQRLQSLIRGGAAVVLVSHNMEQLRSNASRAIWLESGRVRAAGTAHAVTAEYEVDYRKSTHFTIGG